MTAAAFFRVKKLKGGNIITTAARHNRREIQAELGAVGAIDPARMHLNFTLEGPAAAADVGVQARSLMLAAGVGALRKDAVQALELAAGAANLTLLALVRPLRSLIRLLLR